MQKPDRAAACPSQGMLLVIVGLLGVVGGLASCSSEPREVDDPMMIMGDENQPPQVRQAAIKQARDLAGNDAVAVSAVAESMEEVLSSSRTTPEVRITALTTLLTDKDPAVQSRARDVIKKRLPTEDNSKLIALMCSAAADNAWHDCLPALIRSYARDNEPGTTDADRPERAAISALAQGQPIEQAVFAVFANPPAQETTYGVNWTVRLQPPARHVLSRQRLGLDFFDRKRAAFLVHDRVQLFPVDQLKNLHASGVWSGMTTTFNNALVTKGDWEQKWRIPARESWLSQYLPKAAGAPQAS